VFNTEAEAKAFLEECVAETIAAVDRLRTRVSEPPGTS
jgi:hypothetical protein